MSATATSNERQGPPTRAPHGLSICDRVSRFVSLAGRALECVAYHVLLSAVDGVSRLPRNTTVPEAMRLYRKNIPLKAQLDALEVDLAQRTEPAPVPMATRASQAFAYFLTRERALPALLPLGMAEHREAVGDATPLAVSTSERRRATTIR